MVYKQVANLFIYSFHKLICRMLQEDKQLYQLYNDLVVSGVITAEEFWTNRTQVRNALVILLFLNSHFILVSY